MKCKQRDSILADVLPPARLRAVSREAEAFERFCHRLGVPPSDEAVALYLTDLLDNENVSGRGVRVRLQRLDVAARLAGREPWSTHADVRTYLRGLHKEAELRGNQRADPLYQELVYALVDELHVLDHDALRSRAAILIANFSGLPVSLLCRLWWRDVEFRQDAAHISLPTYIRPGQRPQGTVIVPTRNDGLCPVKALRDLKAAAGRNDALVFASRWGHCDPDKIGAMVKMLSARPDRPRRHPVRASTARLTRVLRQVDRPGRQESRDQALILIGYGAALRGIEAIRLRQRDVSVTPQGLVLAIRGRQHLTGVPNSEEPDRCPRQAWITWRAALAEAGKASPEFPAFLQVSGDAVWAKPLSHTGLNYVIHQRGDQARLTGDYAWTSLRSGYIRTAVRAGVPAHAIASHVDLRSLGSVLRHERREQILRTSVAGQLGL